MWNAAKFWCLPTQIRMAKEQLKDALLTLKASNGHIKEARSHLNKLYSKLERYWHTRSRSSCLSFDDLNTAYFHRRTRQLQKFNSIYHILNSSGQMLCEPSVVASYII